MPDEILENIYRSIQPYGQPFCFSVFCIPNFADQIHQDPGPLLCPLALSQVYRFQIKKALQWMGEGGSAERCGLL